MPNLIQLTLGPILSLPLLSSLRIRVSTQGSHRGTVHLVQKFWSVVAFLSSPKIAAGVWCPPVHLACAYFWFSNQPYSIYFGQSTVVRIYRAWWLSSKLTLLHGPQVLLNRTFSPEGKMLPEPKSWILSEPFHVRVDQESLIWKSVDREKEKERKGQQAGKKLLKDLN